MASNGNKKHGKVKKGPSQVRYTAERRWETNKARRIEKERQTKIENKSLRTVRLAKRISGAIVRLKRRLAGKPELAGSIAKAQGRLKELTQ